MIPRITIQQPQVVCPSFPEENDVQGESVHIDEPAELEGHFSVSCTVLEVDYSCLGSSGFKANLCQA